MKAVIGPGNRKTMLFRSRLYLIFELVRGPYSRFHRLKISPQKRDELKVIAANTYVDANAAESKYLRTGT